MSKERLKSMSAFAADLVFPNRCPFCDGFIRWDILCCESCYNKIEWFESDDENNAGRFAAAYYTGVVKDAVIKLKYYVLPNFIKIVADEVVSQISQSEFLDSIDCVIPVPMGRKKQRKIGHNHSEAIADEIAALLNAEKRADRIFKRDSDSEQHTMNAEERAENVKGQYFAPPGNALEGRTVLLCDDVITTGATMDECSRILKEIGAERVLFAAAAVTVSEAI